MSRIIKTLIIALMIPFLVVAGAFLLVAFLLAELADGLIKRAAVVVLAIVACASSAQPALYVQQQVGTESTTMLHLEERVKFAVIQYGIGTDYTPGYRAYIRFGIGHDFGPVSAWAYAPWMNFKSKNGYNTPIGLEVFYKNAVSVQLDGYADGVAVGVKYRHRLITLPDWQKR